MKARYTLLPQMKDYDKMGQKWFPYIMFLNTPLYQCDAVNTDKNGFRFSYKEGTKINGFENNAKASCLLMGGSFVFGVGASSDKTTISSLLNQGSEECWLNFGGRAFSSTQEFLLFYFFQQHISRITKVVIISGVNNLVLNYMSQQQTELGSFFFQQQFIDKMNGVMSKKRRLAKMLLWPIFKESIDYAHIPMRDLIQLLQSRKTLKKQVNQAVEIQESERREQILQIIQRDLASWKVFTQALGVELHYVLQPFCPWIEKEKSKEEVKLFAELDQLQGKDWRVLASKIDLNLYSWFTQQLEIICKANNIHYTDTNTILSNMELDRQWLFVDRIHCTDHGNELIAKIIQDRCYNSR